MLKSEREESIKRLIKIEKQLSKTKNARRLFTEDDSEEDSYSDDFARPMLHNDDTSSDSEQLTRSGKA